MHKGLRGQEILQISSESKNTPARESIVVVGPEAEVAQQPKVSEPADVEKVFQKRENEAFARKTVKRRQVSIKSRTDFAVREFEVKLEAPAGRVNNKEQ